MGMTTPPHIPVDRRPVQQLPYQYRGELRHLHDEPFGGQREPLQLLSQRLVHAAKAQKVRRAPRRIQITWRRTDGIAPPATRARPQASRVGLGGKYIHQASDTNCSTCHNGTIAIGMTTPPHIPSGAAQCSNCHTNTAASFVDLHDAPYGGERESAATPAITARTRQRARNGAQGTASYPGHVATTGRDCVTCHASAAAQLHQLGGRRTTSTCRATPIARAATTARRRSA